MKERIKIENVVHIKDFQEVQNEVLTNGYNANGLLVRGYETLFTGDRNANYEIYEKNALDKCIEEVFQKHNLNIPCTIMHNNDIDHAAGIVKVLETNETGWHFTVFIPESYAKYKEVLNLLKIGYLQGFSKEAYATDWEWEVDAEGNDVLRIKEMTLIRVSLVDMPANYQKVDNIEEIKNATQFVNKQKKELTLDDFFKEKKT